MSGFEEQDYTKEFDTNLWKKIFKFVWKDKKNFFALVFVNTLIAVVDVVFAVYSKYAIDTFITAREMETFRPFIFLYALTVVVQSLNVFLFIYLAGKVEVGLVYEIRKSGFKKLQELSFSYFDTTPVGWLMARMTSDAQKIGDVIAWAFVDIIWGFQVILFAGAVMFIINPPLALIVCTIIPLLGVASYYFQKRILKGYREVRKMNSKITGAFNEGINGARTTKTLLREELNEEEFSRLSGSMRSASVRTAVLSSVYQPVIIFICNIALALVLWRGGASVLGGVIGFGTLSLFISYAVQIFDPIRQIAGNLSEMISAQAAGERTMELLGTEPDIDDTDEVIKIYGSTLEPKKENWEGIRGEIEFEQVDFSYKSGESVLRKFNMNVKAGERIALVGETGSGKSTIVNLLCRFYEPTGGRILIDGKDYKERSQLWLQSNLGYVLQTPHLFSGTVMENIRYGKLEAADEEVMAAAKTVNAYDFIVKLEKGFETEVGEGGSKLSSGERQLISFARVILADPRIFVLDEATSSIDTETEQVIQEAMEKALSGRTSFIVAHRLSTIRSCDRIILIHGGEIVEMGSHRQLIRKKGEYYNLYANQFKEEAEDRILN